MKKLHVISFDNPYPPNYGGVIDVYYKLKALHQSGIALTLHAFEYGRKPSRELEKYCDKIIYYSRKTLVNPFSGSLPYIVSTRDNSNLLDNLLKDNHPILFEGLHTCFFLSRPELEKRKKFVRMHNIEHDYYAKLEEVETNFFKKYFFSKETVRLKKYEAVLKHANGVLAISPDDKKKLSTRYKNVFYLPAFHANTKITSIEGKGKFAFYHGNLSVGENDEAAKFLVTKVFNGLPFELYIAGNKPSSQLKELVKQSTNCKIYEHLSTEQISELIQKAQVNVLPTFQSTGIKLKLLNVLFQGRHVLANSMMVYQSGLEDLCHIADTPDAFKNKLHQLFEMDFTTQEIQRREEVLYTQFDNDTNIEKLISLLFKKR